MLGVIRCTLMYFTFFSALLQRPTIINVWSSAYKRKVLKSSYKSVLSFLFEKNKSKFLTYSLIWWCLVFVNMCTNYIFHISYLHCSISYVGDICTHMVGRFIHVNWLSATRRLSALIAQELTWGWSNFYNSTRTCEHPITARCRQDNAVRCRGVGVPSKHMHRNAAVGHKNTAECSSKMAGNGASEATARRGVAS